MILLLITALAAPIYCETTGGYAIVSIDSYTCLRPDTPAEPSR